MQAATTGEQALAAITDPDPRWPEFVPHALRAGISAVLSTPLTVVSDHVGALNLYSRSDRGFGPDRQALAELITAQAAGVLTAEADDVTAAERISRIQDALRTREVIAWRKACSCIATRSRRVTPPPTCASGRVGRHPPPTAHRRPCRPGGREERSGQR